MVNDFNQFIIIGYIISIFVIFLKFKHNKENNFLDNINKFNILLLLGLIFGKLGYIIIYSNFNNAFVIGGNSYYGSTLGILILLLFYINSYRIFNIIKYVTITPILISFGKIGCYFSNCCDGKIKIFEYEIPIQLFESAFHILIYFIINQKKYDIKISIFQFFIFNFLLRILIYYYREETLNKIG